MISNVIIHCINEEGYGFEILVDIPFFIAEIDVVDEKGHIYLSCNKGDGNDNR